MINAVENIVKSIITARNRVENVRMETINCKSSRTVVEAWVLLNVISVFAINALGIHLFASWVFPKIDKLYTKFLRINASSLIFFLLFSFKRLPRNIKRTHWRKWYHFLKNTTLVEIIKTISRTICIKNNKNFGSCIRIVFYTNCCYNFNPCSIFEKMTSFSQILSNSQARKIRP